MTAVWRHLTRLSDALCDARYLPSGHPGPASHPPGTPGRRADDLRRHRMHRRRQIAVLCAWSRYRLALDAAARLLPEDVQIADLRRVWAQPQPRYAPRATELTEWRQQQDARLRAAEQPRRLGEW